MVLATRAQLSLICSPGGHNDTRRTARVIHHISAVTFAVRDMARSVEFYRKVGFQLTFGDGRAPFSTLKAGEAFVNLTASPGYEHRWWGRVIFRVDDADAQHQALQAKGLMPEPRRHLPDRRRARWTAEKWAVGGAFFSSLRSGWARTYSFAALLPERP